MNLKEQKEGGKEGRKEGRDGRREEGSTEARKQGSKEATKGERRDAAPSLQFSTYILKNPEQTLKTNLTPSLIDMLQKNDNMCIVYSYFFFLI